MKAKLLPCPFCGGMPEKIMIGNDFTKKRSVEIKCTECFTIQKTGAIRASHDQCEIWAIKKWNKRQFDFTSKLEKIKYELSDEWIDREIGFDSLINSGMARIKMKEMRDEILNRLK